VPAGDDAAFPSPNWRVEKSPVADKNVNIESHIEKAIPPLRRSSRLAQNASHASKTGKRSLLACEPNLGVRNGGIKVNN
jgi:hypothetical protein